MFFCEAFGDPAYLSPAECMIDVFWQVSVQARLGLNSMTITLPIRSWGWLSMCECRNHAANWGWLSAWTTQTN